MHKYYTYDTNPGFFATLIHCAEPDVRGELKVGRECTKIKSGRVSWQCAFCNAYNLDSPVGKNSLEIALYINPFAFVFVPENMKHL